MHTPPNEKQINYVAQLKAEWKVQITDFVTHQKPDEEQKHTTEVSTDNDLCSFAPSTTKFDIRPQGRHEMVGLSSFCASW